MESQKILLCVNSDSSDSIRPQCFTCHNSWHVQNYELVPSILYCKIDIYFREIWNTASCNLRQIGLQTNGTILAMLLKSQISLVHIFLSYQWCHNEQDSVSNHQLPDFLLYHLSRLRSKKASKLRFTGLCAGNSPVTGEFPTQRASNAENVSIWWRHHVHCPNIVKFCTDQGMQNWKMWVHKWYRELTEKDFFAIFDPEMDFKLISYIRKSISEFFIIFMELSY